MKKTIFNNISGPKKEALLRRPSINMAETYKIVAPILEDIKTNGLKAALKYAREFDGFIGRNIKVTKAELNNSINKVTPEFKKAIKAASKNIERFHKPQKPQKYSIETMPGIKCGREFRAIENVGLYIPGGTAILPSTLLMLAIPAKIAGCSRIAVCTPAEAEVSPELLFTAKYLGIDEIYKIGGAQAIGIMAYGSGKIKKTDKIFGPGNQYVAAAKALVSIDPDGCAIDMIAGPSEVLIIADDSARADYVAADLLSQAEHGNDSQVILCTVSKKLIEDVHDELLRQSGNLLRRKYVRKSLENSHSILFETIEDAVHFSNSYAPEHLILNIRRAKSIFSKIVNAGSVFVGNYSPESVGDYASGTNHSLPTYGYARSIGGVAVEQFMKGITVQELSKKGLERISRTVIEIAETEKLEAHVNAVKVRMNK